MKSPAIHFILALIIGLMTIVGYSAWYASVSQKSSDVANLQDQITAAKGNVGRIASARVALAEIAGDEKNIQNYFVSEADVVAFITYLEERGQAEKATVSVLSVSTGGTHVLPTLLVALTVKGTFDAVMRTVGIIEYAPYALSISSLSVVEDTKNTWHADMNLTVGSVSQVPATATK
ncbi:MAG: hypothetical protein ACYC48_02550 [Minisyncoccota bacterium]